MGFSLKKKTILLIVSIALVISAISIGVYARGIYDAIETQYEKRVVEIARLVGLGLDTAMVERVRDAVLEIYNKADNKVLSDQWGSEEFEEYVSLFTFIEETEDYKAILAELRKKQAVLDVDCIYITWLDVKNECNVYLVDAALEEPCPVGCIDPIYMEDLGVLKDPDAGLPPNITNTPEYGWLIATGMPIYNESGEVIALSAVDISMNDIIRQQTTYLVYVALVLLLLTVLVSVVSILVVNHHIVKPLNNLSRAASLYKNNRNIFSQLNMTRDDEIGILAQSMAHMEAEINGYISNLEKTTADLISAREHAELMNQAANIDSLTKVRNKRAFDTEVKRLNEEPKPYGLAMIDMNGLKKLNDTYGHEKGDIGIVTICQSICKVFKHSPVYRVGGDEFVVILENNDYEERDELVRTLRKIYSENKANTSLPPWERVTAAVGFAVYDRDLDYFVESVLQRADAAMYENKKAMAQAE